VAVAAGMHILAPGTISQATANHTSPLPGQAAPAGSTTGVATAAVSQAVAPASQPPIDIRDIAAAQSSCQDCISAEHSKVLKVVKVSLDDASVLVDISSGVMRPLVAAKFCRDIFTAVHALAHPGIRATKRLISSRYLWPNLAADVTAWCRECQFCQWAKISKQAAALQPIAVLTKRFSHIHIDIVGPLPASPDSFSHLLTAVDRSTRWAEALPLKATTAVDCTEAFIAGWIARFGVPSHVTSDRGVQFTSSFWAALMVRLRISHKLTTAFHPQSNGAVERFHRRLKDSLRAWLAGSDWPSHLPWVMLGLRAAP
jgi:cleavage and polyadenylation specificity factor subunit 1